MTRLKIGDKAPEFEGVIGEGKTIGLNDFKGRKLLIYFYPKDMTPGCTAQACNLTENFAALEEKNIAIVGVSKDPVKRHDKFADKYSIPFPLIADEDQKVIDAFGVWGEKKFMGKTFDGIHRISFLVDEEGIIIGIWGETSKNKVKTKDHTAQVLEILN